MVYSVLSEPVIPVIMLDGIEKHIGIREVFLEAHNIKDISGITIDPLMRYSLMRLLIAFAMDMLHPETSYEREDLLSAGRFDPYVFDKYVNECESKGPRFDLFDPEHPFLQSPYDEKLDEKHRKSVANIIHSLPSGNNHIFIDHRLEDSHHVTIPTAFAALCSSYVFCTPGTAGPSSVNNTPPLFAIITGNNIFETIIINMLSKAETGSLPYGEGDVAWRNDKKVIPKERVASVSLLEGLTWMPRRICLIPDETTGCIKDIYYQAGLDFKGNDLWNDPHVPLYKKGDTFVTIRPELGREVWRDLGSLLYDRDSKTIKQPMTIKCLKNIYDDEELPEWILIRVAGLITHPTIQAKYQNWCESELSIPSFFLYDQEKAEMLRDDIQLIENVQSVIYRKVRDYFDKPRTKSKTNEHTVATQCQQHFLKAAHNLIFGKTMDEIRCGMPLQDHNLSFCESVKKLIRGTINCVLNSTGDNTSSILKRIEAENEIWKCFNKIVKERNEKYARA